MMMMMMIIIIIIILMSFLDPVGFIVHCFGFYVMVFC